MNPPRRVQGKGWERRNIFPLGSVLGGSYELTSVTAEGRFGQVFAARDRGLRRDVTIKAMWPDLDGGPLRREAQALAAFHHPGLLAVHGIATQGATEYVVQERLDGITLAGHLAKRAEGGGFSIAETLEILLAICDSLTVIHDAELAHDALRPETIMLVAGRVVLFDFGILHVDDPLHDAARRPYLAPEPARDGDALRAGQLRDIYALGVIAFEMLTGTRPAPNESIASQLGVRCAGLPAGLVGLVAELVAAAQTRPRRPDVIGARLRTLQTPERSAAGLSIVVADDDPDIRSLLGAVIRHVSPTARIKFAADGSEALRLVQHAPPDVLFLDLQMPEMTGLEVCMYLRGTSLADQVTICVLSQFGESHRALLHGLGVVDTLVKGSLSPEELALAIGKLFWRLSPEALTSVAAPESSAPEITVGGRYVLEKQLGKGGMGQVFEARHLQLNKRFALKIMNRSFANEPEARARFIQEAKLASEISHPNIVSVVDFGEDAHFGAYMVMELIAGESLSIAMLSLRRACDVLGQIADALALIHRRGIVHGDIKAENIILVDEIVGTRRRKLVRLLDFGLAHRISAERRTSAMVSGTPHYLAPERALGESATVASDVYALGILGYFVISGRLPFDGEVDDILRGHVESRPPPLTAQRGEQIDPALEALIFRALDKDYAKRHTSVSAFRYELNTVMDMMDLGGRRRARTVPEASIDARAAALFTQSRFAQAIVDTEGHVVLANDAFRALAEQQAAEALAGEVALRNLIALVPELPASLVRAHAEGRTVECRHDALVVRSSALRQRDGELHLMAWLDGTS